MLLDDGKGVDAFHISSGSTFPHPRNPPGEIPTTDLTRWYERHVRLGRAHPFQLLRSSRRPIAAPLFRWLWRSRRGRVIEGINAGINAEYLRDAIVAIDPSIKFLCTGGFQHAANIAGVIRERRVRRGEHGPAADRQQRPAAHPAHRQRADPATGMHILQQMPGSTTWRIRSGATSCPAIDGATFEEKWEAMIKDVMSVFQPPLFR